MEDKFTVKKCRQILGNVAAGLTDKEIKELKDFYIAFSDYVIDSRLEKLNLRKNEKTYENQKISP
ncbi:hypothetical protein COY13_03880 [Candidatus Roizmanbacteria bacterium CG_4_10_14_0_2_um_filter_36_35]|uniref:Uncharacterized protein n=5 Tax=Candidatus Roizmaniibacteriota TaxID=1752723 RepID=A0A2M7BX40_9BACT|nr:MAG: hypothetical protein COV86_03675 [Candidatus Roizmanbacteria bacterium CG11_big_fil_rev_8_21_14_0_20_35_14]PIV11143.1 MAG: hypothetical protein COS50_01730 [Candidatus Roizmanbacteria bacterium CG03_land_8_20_14_0_80_35_26]PIZ67156.1 MAG: hypothetical protein COY13_03880 [Candidatus Roizmanbacteria bacterium CG_4_10_14_0_2_um_filter_36_35]PJC33136.1 MAG: hypothetical protein CO049_01050 [Candidatus Roizmanbacteria bacterium CG_4_9_14_0_2_um_filter_36_12]PJC82084.1 MAG: hypothetical prot